jgi:hypothetical protein
MMHGWKRLFDDVTVWDSFDDDDDQDTEEEEWMTGDNAMLVSTDNDPEVLAATRTRDEAKDAAARWEAMHRALNEILAPSTRRVEAPVPTKVYSFVQGEGFAWRDHDHVDVRYEQAEPDPRAVRRARLELPAVELGLLDSREALDAAEAALRTTRRSVYWSRVPASDARVKQALGEIARDVERVAARMQKLVDVVLPEENAKLGPDEFGRPARYIAGEIAFPALVSSDPRVGSLVDLWRAYAKRGGWLA